MNLEYIAKDNKYKTIKSVLKEEFNMSDRLILKLKTSKKIFLNDNIAYINDKIEQHYKINVLLDFVEDNSNIVSTKMKLNILYEDNSMLIVNKPANMAVHPSTLHFNNSLSNGVKYYFDEIGLKKKIRIVNRLDKDTSRNSYFCQK